MKTAYHFRVIALALLLLGGNVTNLWAQYRDSILQEAQAGGWMLRLHTASDVAEGRILGIHSDTVVVTKAAISASEILQIERRIRGSGGWKKGLVLGGIGGAGAIAVLYSVHCEGPGCTATAAVGPMAIGAVVGAAAGALIGEVVAPRPYKWISLWPK